MIGCWLLSDNRIICIGLASDEAPDIAEVLADRVNPDPNST
jgi:hypothetical protein